MGKISTENILCRPPGGRTVDQDYELGKVLGKGAFGTVRLATAKPGGEKLACKSIAKAKLVCREDIQDVQREVAIMNHVAGHPNVVNVKVTSVTAAYTLIQKHIHIDVPCCQPGSLLPALVVAMR
jgi:calcium-dependent protein kinase